MRLVSSYGFGEVKRYTIENTSNAKSSEKFNAWVRVSIKGAYCHYLDSSYHFAMAKVKSNGVWISDRTTASADNWAKADTGLQPNVEDWDYSYGLGS